MVICLKRGALHTAQLMPLPLTVSCSNKIQIGFTFLVPAHPGGPGKRAVTRVCVCVCVCVCCEPVQFNSTRQSAAIIRVDSATHDQSEQSRLRIHHDVDAVIPPAASLRN